MPALLTLPPAAEPVSPEEARAHLRLAAGDDEQMIGLLIATARRTVEARTGLVLMAQQWTCFRDRWPADGVIPLPVAPVLAVSDLAVFGADGERAVIDPSHYLADLASRPARLMLRGSRQWQAPGRALNGIAVTLTAGFGADAASVPAPLRQAVLLLAAHFHAHRGDGAPPPLPANIAALIRPYREARL